MTTADTINQNLSIVLELNTLQMHLKDAAGNFCKWASKLTLAVAWDLLGSNFAAEGLRWLTFYFICCHSLLYVQFELRQNGCKRLGKCSGVNWSVSVWADGVACRHSVVSRDESKCKAQTANQLILTSPVAKRFSIDRPVRTKSTESTFLRETFVPVVKKISR